MNRKRRASGVEMGSWQIIGLSILRRRNTLRFSALQRLKDDNPHCCSCDGSVTTKGYLSALRYCVWRWPQSNKVLSTGRNSFPFSVNRYSARGGCCS